MNKSNARVTRTLFNLVHFFAVLYETKTWNIQIFRGAGLKMTLKNLFFLPTFQFRSFQFNVLVDI